MLNPKLSPVDVSQLHISRERLANQCAMIATMYRPMGFRLEHRSQMRGILKMAERKLICPRPVTRRSLYVFLYLCGLVETGQDTRAAKRWVRETMQRNGIAVPQKGTAMKHSNWWVING